MCGFSWKYQVLLPFLSALYPNPAGTPMKRKMIFDPTGWLSSVTVFGKRMVQALWKKTRIWDDHLPMNLQKERQKFIQEMPNFSRI